MNKPIANNDAGYEPSDVDGTNAPQHTSRTGIRYSETIGEIRISSTQSLESVSTLWRAFERRAILTPFQTHIWLDNWQSHIGTAHGVTPHIVFGHDQSDGLCLIMPFAISRRGGIRTLSWLGNGLAALHAPILKPEVISHLKSSTLERLWHAILETAGKIDLVHLSNQPKRISGHANPLVSLATGSFRSAGCTLPLPDRWSDFAESQEGKPLNEQSGQDIALLRQNGQFEVRLDLPIEDRKTAIELALGAAGAARSGRRKLNPYTEAGADSFFQALATEQMINPLSVSSLNIADQMLACVIGYSHQENYYVSLISAERSERGRAAERVLCEQLVRSCIAQGMNSIAFLSGTAPLPEWRKRASNLCEHLEAVSGKGRRSIGLIRLDRAARQIAGMSDRRIALPARFGFEGPGATERSVGET